MQIDFAVLADYGEVGTTEHGSKRLRLVKWGVLPAKIDLRVWNMNGERPGKGITLTQSEAHELLSVLQNILE